VLWIPNTGAQWHMLPQCYPNYKTVQRRFQQWCGSEVLRVILKDSVNELCAQGEIDESECCIDASVAMARGGGDQIGRPDADKASKSWRSWIAMACRWR
jgi:hypothetical protein